MVSARRIAVVSMLSIAVSWGCISSPVIAPTDGQLLVSANPTSIVLDEFAVPAVTSASSVITAQLLSASGVPQAGVSVLFATDGGELASSPAGQAATPLETDDNGIVTDTLTLRLGDPPTTTVTVGSGTLTQTIGIEKTEIQPNRAPIASIEADPSGSALVDETVLYDGSTSSDPDGDAITCYQWQFETSENISMFSSPPLLDCEMPNSACGVSQGPTNSLVTRSYEKVQDADVTLRVTDDPSIACPPGGPAESSAAFSGLTVHRTNVVCDRSDPIANAGSDEIVTLGMNSTPVTVPLSGANSFDLESSIMTWTWNCGNGTGIVTCPGDTDCRQGPSASSDQVECTYSAASTTPYTVQLTVTNDCLRSGSDTIRVTVNPSP